MAPPRKQSATTAVATPAAPVDVAAPPVKPAATRVPKSAKAPAAEVTPAVVEKTVDKVAAVVEATEGGEVAEGSTLAQVVAKVNTFASLIKDVQTLLKTLTKEYDRMKKTVDKTERKRANARTNPNGFAKPAKITDDMCDFLSVPHGSELSRTDVTRRINAYIKEHNLNKPENKRIILPDDKLRKILGVKNDEEVSFFSLQKYLSRSFVKKPVVAAV